LTTISPTIALAPIQSIFFGPVVEDDDDDDDEDNNNDVVLGLLVVANIGLDVTDLNADFCNKNLLRVIIKRELSAVRNPYPEIIHRLIKMK